LSASKPTLAERVLNWLADAIYRHPRLFLYPQLGLFGLCIWYTVFSANHLQFDTSRDNLVGSDKKYHQNFLKFKAEFPGQDDLVVIVESDETEKNRQFVERLGARLEAETNLFTDVFFRSDFKMLGSKALLFVPEGDLGELQKKIKDYKPFIENFSRATNLGSMFQLINTQFRTSKEEDNPENQALIGALPALERIVISAADSLERPGTPPSPGVSALFGGGPEADQAMYITFAGGKIYLVTAHSKSAALNHEAVTRMRELVAETKAEVPGVNVGLTGEPVIELDEMDQSQSDTTVATIVSLVIVVLIFVFGYNAMERPFKSTFCLIIGLGYTMGYTTLAVGHLNILTITFAPMLIGMAIDFGVHLVTRFEEELLHGRTEREALRKAIVYTGMGIFTGCFTTAGAFFAMGITDFKGIQEMGIISGGGLLICLVPMMTMLPVLLMKKGGKHPAPKKPKEGIDRRARIERYWLERPALVAGITVTFCLFSLLLFPRVYFDYNLLNMQSEGLPAVVYEKKLINNASNSVLFGAVIANTLEEAVKLEATLTNLPVVSQVRSMSQFLAENQTRKLELIHAIKRDVESIHFAEIDHGPVNIPDLSQTIYSLQGYLGTAMVIVKKGQNPDANLLKHLQSLWDALGVFRNRMLKDNREVNARKLGDFQRALLGDLQDTFQTIQRQDDSGPLQAKDLPPSLRNRFIGVTGKYLLQVYPRKDVWQRNHQEEFVRELRRALDPNQTDKPVITGTPVQLLEYTTLLKDSYVEAAWYSLGAIIILVFVHFRSVMCVLLALLPVAIGMIWMGGFMGITGIPFNPANIMTLPLVIGVGVTNGIHILNRFSEEKNPSILAKSTGKAVLVSGLTTIAGFGSLILGKHQGIESLGYVMAVGTATCMVAGLTFLPALLNILNRRGWQIKKTQ
jgi:hopanoid biosynthesis associated RND transporter like protein HpnN